MLIIFYVPILLAVHAMVMDCGINLIRFRNPDQIYCNKSQKRNSILFKTFILQKVNVSPTPYTQTYDCPALSLHVNVSGVCYKKNTCKCE